MQIMWPETGTDDLILSMTHGQCMASTPMRRINWELLYLVEYRSRLSPSEFLHSSRAKKKKSHPDQALLQNSVTSEHSSAACVEQLACICSTSRTDIWWIQFGFVLCAGS